MNNFIQVSYSILYSTLVLFFLESTLPLFHRGNGYGSMSLPHIPNVPSLVKKDDTRPVSDTRKKKRREGGRTDTKEDQQPIKNGNNTADMELSGTTAFIKPRHQTTNKVQHIVCTGDL